MKLMDTIHENLLMGRRARVLSDRIAALVPEEASMLDVGSGDGEIASRIMARRPDVSIRGIDVLVRPSTAISVDLFDGSHFPFDDDSFDVVSFIDVLHHTADPVGLLTEAARVARRTVIIKDHVVTGIGAERTLRFMDTVGNERHGVVLPYNYLTHREWVAAIDEAGLTVERWDDRLGIYAWPATFVFDRRLHVLAALKA